MMAAAVVSSLRVFLTRDAMTCSGLSPVALISGIIETPVSNPDRPRTSRGKAMTAGPIRSMGPPPALASSRSVQPAIRDGSERTWANPAATTAAFRSR
ncbi:hypothetical protein SRABI128_06313 [Microbacterium sp. Bi128]|nr:hypothetical protein SRABI128_06313 [Microbacterium sp. Bi128]